LKKKKQKNFIPGLCARAEPVRIRGAVLGLALAVCDGGSATHGDGDDTDGAAGAGSGTVKEALLFLKKKKQKNFIR